MDMGQEGDGVGRNLVDVGLNAGILVFGDGAEYREAISLY